MKSKVTTKQGDAGNTKALDGSALDKSHPMIEAVGMLDELRTQTAMLRLQVQGEGPDALTEIGFLHFLLHTYFLLGTIISDPHGKKPEWRRGEITREHLAQLEAEQERMEAGLRLPRAFIVSATNTLAAQADIVAAVARTFERRMVAFCLATPDFDHPVSVAFVNRLSDYFFILARHLEKGHHQPVNYELLDGK